MCLFNYHIRVAVAFCAIMFSGYCDKGEPSTLPPDTAALSRDHVGESDWSIYMDAPRYHFALAMEYLKKGDHSKASKELARGNSFLSFQAIRISVVVKEIEKLSASLATGKQENIPSLDSLTAKAMKVLSSEYTMLPIEVGINLVFKEEYDYLFDKAKTNVRNNNPLEAADEIRRASSLIRLQAAATGRFIDAELDSAENELTALSSRIASGSVVEIKELDSAFQKAVHVLWSRPETKKNLR